MKKLLKLGFSVFCLLATVFFLASLGSVYAQEAVEIPRPELKDASFVQVKNLNIGDVVFVKGEVGELVPSTITKLEYHQEPVEVYNLSVDGEQTFFANDFAVHNKSGVDTTKPQCRVIVNPTIENANGLVKNRSFETPGDPVWCPQFWYNAYEGSWWCDYGLEIKSGSACGGCGSKVVELGYPYFYGRQDISGLVPFGNQKVLYRVSAWGRGRDARLYFREPASVRYGTFAYLCYGCSSNKWGHQSLLGWANSTSEPISILGETRFDLVSLEKLTGSTQVTSSEVNLFVGFYDNRNVGWLRHWNQGESPPDWDSGDPRVIGFGPVNPRADGISHTLTGSDSQMINVQVRDWSGNVSDCSVTVNYTPPTGTITGNVYQNEWGLCSDDGREEPPPGWAVECQVGGIWITAHQEGNQFTCCADSSCSSYVLPQNPSVPYLVRLIPPADWELVSGASCPSNPQPVYLDSASETAIPFSLWQGLNPWFQTKEGDVHSGGRIVSRIPLADTYFSVADAGDYPGLVSYVSDDLPDFGRGSVSEKGWLAEDEFSAYAFTFFEKKLKGEAKEEEFDGSEPSGPENNGVYYSDIGRSIDNAWNVNPGESYIILINGNLTINNKIDVDPGGFLAFIVNGDIIINGSVGVTPGSGADNGIQGIYFADQTFDTGDSDQQLLLEGIFVANEFQLRRDLGDNNDTYPGEIFIARPDLFVNLPEELKESYFFEQEVAP